MPELEKQVAETKNGKIKYDNFVSIEMRNWLDSGVDGVTDLASINKKRKELEEYAY